MPHSRFDISGSQIFKDTMNSIESRMDQPAVSKPLNRAQSSIRSFFQPRTPIYAAPPSSTNSAAIAEILPPKSTPLPTTAITRHSHPEQAVPSLASSASLPPQASISTIHENNIQPLKRINSLLLPINYPDSFYHKILEPNTSPNFSRVILWQDAPSSEPKVVGGIVCRLEHDEFSKVSSIYIQSLALLSPYRSHGLATAALEELIAAVIKSPLTDPPITSLYAHVWVENAEGLEWYTARGFIREEPVVHDYYRRLKPGDAWIMRRPLVPSDHMRHTIAQKVSTSTPNNPTTSISPQLPGSNAASSTKQPLSSPSPVSRAASYQKTGPGHEWNDLPEEILSPKLQLSSSSSFLKPESGHGSVASSRSSSSTRNGGKKKRQYPAAAFGATTPGTGA